MSSDFEVKKNMLDLRYSRYLSYHNTAIVLFFTYVIALVIVCVTFQLDYSNVAQLLLTANISAVMLSGIVVFMMKSKDGMDDVLENIRRL